MSAQSRWVGSWREKCVRGREDGKPKREMEQGAGSGKEKRGWEGEERLGGGRNWGASRAKLPWPACHRAHAASPGRQERQAARGPSFQPASQEESAAVACSLIGGTRGHGRRRGG